MSKNLGINAIYDQMKQAIDNANRYQNWCNTFISYIDQRLLDESIMKRYEILWKNINRNQNKSIISSTATTIDIENKNHIPLKGLIVSLKDNFCSSQFPTTAGSKLLNNFSSGYDCTIWERLEKHGAILIGLL